MTPERVVEGAGDGGGTDPRGSEGAHQGHLGVYHGRQFDERRDERLRYDLAFAAPELWMLHVERRMAEAVEEACAAAVAPLEKALRELTDLDSTEPAQRRQPEFAIHWTQRFEAARTLLASAPSPVREPERTPATWLIDQDFDE